LATVMTGSRTGAGVFVIGASAVLYARLGRAVLLIPIVVGIAYGMLSLVESLDLTRGLARLTSGADTRSEAWRVLLREAMNHPLFGSPAMTKFTENSYLMGVASYGLGMAVLMLVLLCTSAYQSLRLWRARHWLDLSERRLVDLILGFNAAYFLGAFFEWYILARLDIMMIMFLIFSGMSTHLLDLASANAAASRHPLLDVESSTETLADSAHSRVLT
jgi:hypothetical protein